jgi:hypothetical protein
LATFPPLCGPEHDEREGVCHRDVDRVRVRAPTILPGGSHDTIFPRDGSPENHLVVVAFERKRPSLARVGGEKR